jgi:hypothetical protein
MDPNQYCCQLWIDFNWPKIGSSKSEYTLVLITATRYSRVPEYMRSAVTSFMLSSQANCPFPFPKHAIADECTHSELRQQYFQHRKMWYVPARIKTSINKFRSVDNKQKIWDN